MPKIPRVTGLPARCPRWYRNPSLKSRKKLSLKHGMSPGAGCAQKTVLLQHALFSGHLQLILDASAKAIGPQSPSVTIEYNHLLHARHVTTCIPTGGRMSTIHPESLGVASGHSRKPPIPTGARLLCRGQVSDLFPVARIEWHRAPLHGRLSLREERMCIGENSERERKHIRLTLPESPCERETTNHPLRCLNQARGLTSQKN